MELKLTFCRRERRMTREPLFLRASSGCAPRFRFDPTTTTRSSKIASAITTSRAYRLYQTHGKGHESDFMWLGFIIIACNDYAATASGRARTGLRRRKRENEGKAETSSRPRSTPPLDAAFPRVH